MYMDELLLHPLTCLLGFAKLALGKTCHLSLLFVAQPVKEVFVEVEEEATIQEKMKYSHRA